MTRGVRRLTPLTPVVLALDGDRSVPATVVALSRDGVRLSLDAARWPAGEPELRRARLVSTDRRGSTLALDGIAQRLAPGDVRWFAAELALSSRRGTPRLRIALEATVHRRPATTVDLSTTGVLLRCPPGPIPPEVDVTLDLAGTPVAVRAAIVRARPDATAFRFLDLAAEDSVRITAVVDVIAMKVAETG